MPPNTNKFFKIGMTSIISALSLYSATPVYADIDMINGIATGVSNSTTMGSIGASIYQGNQNMQLSLDQDENSPSDKPEKKLTEAQMKQQKKDDEDFALYVKIFGAFFVATIAGGTTMALSLFLNNGKKRRY